MTAIVPAVSSERLHRGVKMALDSGEAPTLEAAEALFRTYRLNVVVGDQVATSPTFQTALFTIVNTARRAFLGGVDVAASRRVLDAPLHVPWNSCQTVEDVIYALRGRAGSTLTSPAPTVVLGDGDISVVPTHPVTLRTTFDGWVGGVVPFGQADRLAEQREFAPAGILAGSLAVSEAFQHVRGDNPMAGRRSVGLSLWHPEPTAPWLTTSDLGPPLELLPTALWLVGLGHLGQAYLWTLGFLPYADPTALHLVLQDFDTLSQANDSTSPVTTLDMIGHRKTRAMADWAEGRGFTTTLMERPFAADFHVSANDPPVALIGVDNANTRAAIEEVGFRCIVEAGLGKTANEYLAFQIHRFPGPQSARNRWGTPQAVTKVDRLLEQPGYRDLAALGVDECGLTQLAGRSVGAPFVGTAVSSLVIAEVLRLLIGGPSYGLIDGTLRSLNHRETVPCADEGLPFNPGFTGAQPMYALT